DGGAPGALRQPHALLGGASLHQADTQAPVRVLDSGSLIGPGEEIAGQLDARLAHRNANLRALPAHPSAIEKPTGPCLEHDLVITVAEGACVEHLEATPKLRAPMVRRDAEQDEIWLSTQNVRAVSQFVTQVARA